MVETGPTCGVLGIGTRPVAVRPYASPVITTTAGVIEPAWALRVAARAEAAGATRVIRARAAIVVSARMRRAPGSGMLFVGLVIETS